MKEILREDIKRDKNLGNKILLAIMIGGYSLFLTSRFWMPDMRELIEATPYYETLVMEKHELYLTRWEFSEQDQTMEIILEVKSKELVDEGLNYEAVERTKGKLDINPVLETADYMIFRIDEVPEHWQEISLRLTEKQGSGDILRLYTNTDAVERVDSLPEKTEAEYETDRLLAQIDYDAYQISEKEKKIEGLEQENQDLQERISELETAKYPSEEEAEEAENTVMKAQAQITANDSDIEELGEEIAELQKRTEEIQKQIGQSEEE